MSRLSPFPCECGDYYKDCTDSRPGKSWIRRRRTCSKCGRRLTTWETPEPPRDHPSIPSRDKVLHRVLAALRKIVELLDEALTPRVIPDPDGPRSQPHLVTQDHFDKEDKSCG